MTGVSATGRPKVFMKLQVLRRCPKCHAPHPKALNLECIDVCSNCGEPSVPPSEVETFHEV